MDIQEQAKGRWRSILPMMGIPGEVLNGKQHPCPVCGGKDRFRFDDKEGTGSSYCNQCGARHGIDMVMAMKGLAFKDAVQEVRGVLGESVYQKPRPAMTEEERMAGIKAVWRDSRPVTAGDPVHAYMVARGIDNVLMETDTIRCIPRYRYEGRTVAVMLTKMTGPDGAGVTLQRNYIENGRKIARAFMPGTIPVDTVDARIMRHGDHLGVAEGVETAVAAFKLHGVPSWATLTAGYMAKWTPPEGVKRVTIFGDNDASFTGHFAAYKLARRLDAMVRKSERDMRIDVRIPETIGRDWWDEWHARQQQEQPA